MEDIIKYKKNNLILCEDLSFKVAMLKDSDIPFDAPFSIEYVKVVYDIYMKLRVSTGKIPMLLDLHDETLTWAEEKIMEICFEENKDNLEFRDNEDEYYENYLEYFYNTVECYKWGATLLKVLDFLGLTCINDYDYDEDDLVCENGAQRKLFEENELVGIQCWI